MKSRFVPLKALQLMILAGLGAGLLAVPSLKAQEESPVEAATGEESVGSTQDEDEGPSILAEQRARKRKDEPNFGASEREVSAAKIIADIERRRHQRAEAFGRNKIGQLETYEYEDMRGPTVADAVKNASVRALLSTASQLYFDEYIIIGRDLLEPYLRVYGDRFVARHEVLNRSILADGTNSVDVRVSVDVDRFYRDLAEKHFIGRPQLRPVTAILLEENLDGQPSSAGRGRVALEDALSAVEIRIASGQMGAQPLDLNVMKTPESLLKARQEAQRGDVQVIVTGTLDVQSRGQKKILYDDFYFFTAFVKLAMIRVDTGEVLAETEQSFSSSAQNSDAALDATFKRLMPRCVEPLVATFLDDWRNTMLDVGDYRLMVKGVDRQSLESIINGLKTLSPSVQTYVKVLYADVAVINVFYPGSRRDAFEGFLRKSRVPQFVVRPSDERRYELRVL